MQTFRQLFNHKTSRNEFKKLYETECHVCGYTMRIFEKADRLGMDLNHLAADVDMGIGELRELRDADWCNPYRVIALCHHLNLEPPAACPRMKKSPEATLETEDS